MGGAPARAVEIFLDPRMAGGDQFGNRSDRDDALVRDHCHAVADFVESIEIVGNEEHRQAERFLEVAGQPVKLGRADRIETGGGFIEEQQFGIERQRARKPGALPHPARQFGWKLRHRILGQAGEDHLVARDLAAQLGIKVGVELLQWHFDILAHRQGREERAALKQHAPAAAHTKVAVGVEPGEIVPQHLDVALGRRLQADDRAHQHRLARSRAAHHAENLAALHRKIEAFVDREIAEAVDEAFDHDRRPIVIRVIGDPHQPHPISVKNTAKKASSTITAKIAETTAMVVRRPTSSELLRTCKPL